MAFVMISMKCRQTSTYFKLNIGGPEVAMTIQFLPDPTLTLDEYAEQEL